MPSHILLKRHEGVHERRQDSSPPVGPSSTTETTPPVPPTPSTTSTSSSTSTSTSETSTSNTPATTPPATTPPRASNTRPTATDASVTRPRTTVTKSVSSPSISSTAEASESDTGMGVGSFVGIGVAGVVAVAVIAAFVIWLIRRRRRQQQDAALDEIDTPFDRSSFMRHSAVIPDDPHAPPFSPGAGSTRGPVMVEKGYGAAAAIPYTASTYPQDNFNYGLPAGGLAPGGYYNNNNTKPAPPSNYGPGGAPISEMPGLPQTFATPNPFDQYAALSRDGPAYHMAPYDPNTRNSGEFTTSAVPAHRGQVVEAKDSHDGNSAQYGFAPPYEQTARGHGQAHGNKKRPDTVYDEDDAYGGM